MSAARAGLARTAALCSNFFLRSSAHVRYYLSPRVPGSFTLDKLVGDYAVRSSCLLAQLAQIPAFIRCPRDFEMRDRSAFGSHFGQEDSIYPAGFVPISREVLHVIPKHSDRIIKAILQKHMSGLFCLSVTVVPAITAALEALLFSTVA